MFCPNCGSNVPDTERFCPTCGTAMGGNAAPEAPAAPAKPDVVSLIKSKLPLIIGAVVAVVAVVFLWNLLFGGSTAAKYVKAANKGDVKGASKVMFVKSEDSIEAQADKADMKLEDYYKDVLDAEDYKDYCEERKEDADDENSDEYGSNWKTKAKELGSTTDLSDDEEKQIESILKNYEELDLIDDADDYDKYKKVWVLYSFSGSDGEYYGVETVYMVKKGLSWKVLY